MKNTQNPLLAARAASKNHKKYTRMRFVSVGVSREIPLTVQNCLWKLLEMLPVEPDCLIIYRLMPDENGLQIEQSQLLPQYQRTVQMTVSLPVNAVYLVDEDDRYTMMLREEFHKWW